MIRRDDKNVVREIIINNNDGGRIRDRWVDRVRSDLRGHRIASKRAIITINIGTGYRCSGQRPFSTI